MDAVIGAGLGEAGHICLHLSGLQTAAISSVSNGIRLQPQEDANGPFFNILSKEN